MAYARLRKLIELMETLPREADKHFGMEFWYDHKGKHKHGLLQGDVLKKDHLLRCGTKACAAGWASTMPYFRKLGLTSVWDGAEGADLAFDGVVPDDAYGSLAGLLEIDRRNAVILFGPEGMDETPKQWAKRARNCIRIWSKE
jgi:hypothetical protein